MRDRSTLRSLLALSTLAGLSALTATRARAEDAPAPAVPAVPAAKPDSKPDAGAKKEEGKPFVKPAADAPSVTWKITYRTKLSAPPEGSKVVEAWIPVPFESDLQKVTDLTVTTSVPYTVEKDPATGNRMVHVRVEPQKGDLQIDWTATVLRRLDEGQARTAVRPEDLQGDAMAPIDGVAKQLAKDLGADDATRPVAERARKIYDHVLASMVYDKETPGWGKGDLDRAVKVGKGNCSDFAAKFIAIARASGIPARWSSSIALTGDHANCSACGYHCYARFYDGARWVPVDPSDARRAVAADPKMAAWLFGHVPASSVVLSVGRDLTLVPKQQAGPVNFFGGPYVEVDGKPVSVPSENRTYEYEAK